MRYEIQSYRFRGVEFFRIIDTFNGGKIIAKGFQTDAKAITRRDELNQFNAPTRMDVTADISSRVLNLVDKGHVNVVEALRIACGTEVVDAMIESVYNELRAKAVR